MAGTAGGGAAIIDGVAEAERLRGEVATEVEALVARGVRPGLRVVLAGEHPASMAYVRTKERMAEAAGIDAGILRLPADVGEAELLAAVVGLNRDPAVHGILVQLPLPAGIDPNRVLTAIDPNKDVDGFHPLNAGRLATAAGGRAPDDLLVPCTPRACVRLLERRLGPGGLAGANAVVVGRSTIVGRPLAQLLLLADATVTVAHSRSRDLPALARSADVLVAAVGRAELVRGDWVREGAVVIDVGINRVAGPDGKSRLVGDVAYAEALPRAGAITPVPGGVGPMTVACLLANTALAARLAAGGGRG